MQDMLLADIDRIEIIRGPGGTMWGANAVNGVINILTKKASKTQGAMVSFVGGSHERNLSARYGGKINEKINYRLFAKGKHVEKYNDTPDHRANDEWKNLTTGFRVDGEQDSGDTWMIQGGYIAGKADQSVVVPSLTPPSNNLTKDVIDYQSGNILFRWDKQYSAKNKWRFQTYYDYFDRRSVGARNRVHTFDIDIQNQLHYFESHDIVWGIGYRGVFDQLAASFAASFDPRQRNVNTFSTFVQDEIQLNDAWRLTLGSKIQHNSYSGFEFQPNVRILWAVNDRHSLWGAFSRAVRVPSRAFRDLRFNLMTISDPTSPVPTLVSAFGSKNSKSEKVHAFELGYRSVLSDTLTLDTAFFYNYYDDLTTTGISFGFEQQPIPHILVANTFDNNMTASTYGAEILAKWQATDFWQLIGSYSWLKIDAKLKNGSVDNRTKFFAENSDPRHQFSIRSNIQLPHNLEFDSTLFFTGNLKAHSVNTQARLDLRLAWKLTPKISLSVVGQNITNKQHTEFTSNDSLNAEIPRSIYGRMTLRF